MNLAESIISGSIVAVASVFFQWLINRRQSEQIQALKQRTQKLEDEKISALEARDDEILRHVNEAIGYATKGRKELHDRLNNDMVTRREYQEGNRMVLEAVAELKQEMRTVILDAKQASRDVAKLEGKLEAGGNS